MPSKNKARGNRFERLVISRAKNAGFEAERAWGSDGKSLGLTHDVDGIIKTKEKTWKLQMKKRKRLASYVKPSENVDVQVIGEDREEPLVVVPLNEFLKLIEDKQ